MPRPRLTRAFAEVLAVLGLLACAPPRLPPRAEPPPGEWLEGAVVYGVVPSLFGTPPLRSVVHKLDYLRGLGVDALWLPPLNRTNDPGAISYLVTDYFALREDFGTPEDLRTLVREAHARGMKVLLDFVPNHTSSGHPFYVDAEAKGRRSRYFEFYDRGPDGRATHYFDWAWLPNLNYGNPEVRRMMTEAFSHWVRAYDVDGFRVDAAWEIRDRAPDFWPKLTRTLQAFKPGLFLLAEASARDPYYLKNGFHAAYDWTDELGKWAWGPAFDNLGNVGPALARALQPAGTPLSRVARFLNNNDTGERFITRHGLGLTRVAAVLLHTVPGIPIVYSGDEVGAQSLPYESPPPLRFEDPHGLRPLYQRLADLRERLPALRRGSFVLLTPVGHPTVLAFLRDAGQAEQALVVLNFGETQAVQLTLPSGAPSFTWDLLAQAPPPPWAFEKGELTLRLSRQQAYVLVPERPVP